MSNVNYIEHQGKRILHIRFPDTATFEEQKHIIFTAKYAVAREPFNSVLTLTELGDFHFNADVTEEMRRYIEHNKPFVKAAAVLGVKGVKKIIYSTFLTITGRKMKLFDDIEEAKDYLVSIE
jgi:hypothetical protein